MKRADEMEMYISLKSTRNAWIFTIVSLLAWTWFEYAKDHDWGMPFIILTGSLMIFWLSQLIIKRTMAGKNEE